MTSVLAGPLLDPSREVAREWARRELGDPAYARARPGWVTRLARWLLARLQDLQVPDGLAPGRTLGLVLLLVLLAGVVTMVLTRTGPLRRAGRTNRAGAVLDEHRRGAAEHRSLADEAAAAGRWTTAVRERFRAVARSLEERTVLDERAGRTALETATEAGGAMPAVSVDLRSAARLFDDVVYGGRPATAAHDRQLRQLDDQVAAARPLLDPVAAPR